MKSILIAALMALATPALGQGFTPSDDALYVGWPGLEGTGFAPDAEARVYAIVDNSGVTQRPVYVILHDNHRFIVPVGVMVCEERFEVLASEGNGWHDILCGNPGRSTVWIMGGDGLYRPQ